MIKEYFNGNDFILENENYLNTNEYLAVFFFLNSKVLTTTNKINYIFKCENKDKKLLVLRKEPFNTLVFGDKECVAEMFSYLDKNSYYFEGVLGQDEVCEEIVSFYKEKGIIIEKEIGMDFMRTDKRCSVECKEIEIPKSGDEEEIFECLKRFVIDCGLNDEVKKEDIKSSLDNFRIIRCEGEIASIAKIAPSSSTSKRISCVYTRDEFRCLGLARKVVGSILNEIVDKGLIATLNVDQKNPISNHLYASLGFTKVFSQGIYIKKDV
ncbi:MAG: GNAT family N-acetyltransferase [Bacilli bacterium]